MRGSPWNPASPPEQHTLRGGEEQALPCPGPSSLSAWGIPRAPRGEPLLPAILLCPGQDPQVRNEFPDQLLLRLLELEINSLMS